jgi:hypothetical protein
MVGRRSMSRELFSRFGGRFGAGLDQITLFGKAFGFSSEAILAFGVLLGFAILFLASLFEVVVGFSGQKVTPLELPGGVGGGMPARSA